MSNRKDLRNQSQQQNLKKYFDNQNSTHNIDTIRLGDRDSDTNKDNVVYPNNSEVTAGQRVFNASLPIGVPVQATQSQNNALIALNQRSYSEDDDFIEEDLQLYHFKVLFSITENEITSFYIGGDRDKPKKIFEVPESYNAFGYVTNTGKNVNSWIAGILYAIPATFPEEPVSVIESFGVGNRWKIDSKEAEYYSYKGSGFWTTNLIKPTFAYDPTFINNTFVLNKSRDYPFLDIIVPTDFTLSASSLPNFLIGNAIGEYKSIYFREDFFYPEGSYRGYESFAGAEFNESASGQASSFYVYKGEVVRHNGTYVKSKNYTANRINNDYVLEPDISEANWSASETEHSTGQISILPGTYRNISSFFELQGTGYPPVFHDQSSYNNTNYYSNFLDNFENVQLADTKNLSAYVTKIINKKSNNDQTITTRSQYFHISNKDIELFNDFVLFPNGFDTILGNPTQTNLLKNIFYYSPLTKISNNQVLPPDYINKTVRVKCDTYTIDNTGAINKSLVYGKVLSLKIKSDSDYTLHGISYYP